MNNQNRQIIRKNKILKITALLGLFLLVFGVSYALFSVVLEGTKKNKISTGTISLKLTDKEGNDETEGYGINLENTVPISAKEALETVDPYEFNIENNGTLATDYELYIDLSDDTTLDTNNVKYSLVRMDTGEILSYNYYNNSDIIIEPTETLNDMKYMYITSILGDVKTVRDNKTVYKLDLGTIGPGQIQKYSLKMWIPYSADNSAMNKTFEGKLKIYGTQTTKDSAYVVKQIDLTEYNSYPKLMGGQIFAKLYSDRSLRLEGIGKITAEMINISNFDMLAMQSCYNVDAMLLEANKICEKYGYEMFENFESLYLYLSEGINNDTTHSEDFIQEMFELDSNLSSMAVESDLYIGDGIIDIGTYNYSSYSSVFGSLYNFKKVYISTTVQNIYSGAFYELPYLKEVEFVKAKDNYLYNTYEKQGLSINGYAFRSNPVLTKVHILNNLTSIGNDAFLGSTNANLTIEALQSNVNLEQNSLKDVKSVTWLNG